MTVQNQKNSHLIISTDRAVYNKGSHSPRCQEDRLSREHEYAYVDELTISNINSPASKGKGTSLQVPGKVSQPAHVQGPLPPPLPVENRVESPLRVPVVAQPNPAVLQDTVSLPDFEHLSQNYSYSTLDSRNFSALERESQRNREGLRDQDNEARYS